MKTEQLLFTESWTKQTETTGIKPQLVLAFGNREVMESNNFYDNLNNLYPQANIVSCSGSGEILANKIYDNNITATAIEFEKTDIKTIKYKIGNREESFDIGTKIGNDLNSNEKLAGILILSEGLNVNGTRLAEGVNSITEGKIPVTGGLAGDQLKFEHTLVGLNAKPESNTIVAIGFYGDNIEIGHGSKGGWDAFGPERTVTKANDNILYELDGRSALDLYKEYLGPEKAKELPGSALLFPLSLKTDQEGQEIVRTILAVDEDEKSMTFAGDIPSGATVQLMKANFDKLIDASGEAAEISRTVGEGKPELAILISCVGRKAILGQLIDEEIDEAVLSLGNQATYTGFYSYGEISPLVEDTGCKLHNQTMTITTFTEK